MAAHDLFAQALWQYYEKGRARLDIEREDGVRYREDLSWYFTPFREFPRHEKQALYFARGRVLDIGCGAGRHSIALQRRGLEVTAIDVSPRLVELARERGVKNVQVAGACGRLDFGRFDTVLLFGNNLGICGDLPEFRKMLRELHRITSPRGRVLATTRTLDASNPKDLDYMERNLERGRALGQVRLRLILGRTHGPWFDLLLFSPTDLLREAVSANWRLARLFPLQSIEEGYAVVLEKG